MPADPYDSGATSDLPTGDRGRPRENERFHRDCLGCLMVSSPPALLEFGRQLEALGWVTDLLVAGSLATGDYIPDVSDLDLVALVDGPVDGRRQSMIAALHRQLDTGAAAGLDLGCVYFDAAQRADVRIAHPTWTHGSLVQRILSGITRAELVRHGYAIFGRSPCEVLPAMTDDDVREAARAELTGYWAWAARRPRMWLNPVIADLGLTSMARGRHALHTGKLLTKPGGRAGACTGVAHRSTTRCER
jgi:hypothetical protein